MRSLIIVIECSMAKIRIRKGVLNGSFCPFNIIFHVLIIKNTRGWRSLDILFFSRIFVITLTGKLVVLQQMPFGLMSQEIIPCYLHGICNTVIQVYFFCYLCLWCIHLFGQRFYNTKPNRWRRRKSLSQRPLLSQRNSERNSMSQRNLRSTGGSECLWEVSTWLHLCKYLFNTSNSLFSWTLLSRWCGNTRRWSLSKWNVSPWSVWKVFKWVPPVPPWNVLWTSWTGQCNWTL